MGGWYDGWVVDVSFPALRISQEKVGSTSLAVAGTTVNPHTTQQ